MSSRSHTESLHGVPFTVQYGCWRAKLPLVEILLEYRTESFVVVVNGEILRWKDGQKPPTTAPDAAARALAAAREKSDALAKALGSARIPDPEEAELGPKFRVYIFTKSGSRVRIIGPAQDYRKQPCVTVARIDTGKEMVVPRSALVPEADYPTDEVRGELAALAQKSGLRPEALDVLAQRIRNSGFIDVSIFDDVRTALRGVGMPDLADEVTSGRHLDSAAIRHVLLILEASGGIQK